MHVRSVKEAREVLRELWKRGESIGSIHTLGALHEGHARLIELSAEENLNTIVTIYPNKIQLFPGSRYVYDLEEDAAFATRRGATLVISSNDDEMYPPEYCTYIDQLERHHQLNSSIFPYATRGQVTGAIRWISLTRPTRSYFGMKDIEQALMVERAVADLMIDCEIRHVPCIRYRNGVPISSRLVALESSRFDEVGNTYAALQQGRFLALHGETSACAIVESMRSLLEERLRTFRIVYTTVVDANTFQPIELVRIPFILHCAVTDGKIYHFDGFCARTRLELEQGPEVIWLD
jgi:pantoate--beta-alanine ligase